MMISSLSTTTLIFALGCSLVSAKPAGEKTIWRPVEFAIVRFNDEAPKSWNLYHTEKKGILLVRIWKRYLLVNVIEQEAYDIDPQTVKPVGENVEWSMSDLPNDPLDVSEWKERNVGPVQRVRFRLGKEGHFLEIQIPLKADGKPAY
jgi:hypothetical protein